MRILKLALAAAFAAATVTVIAVLLTGDGTPTAHTPPTTRVAGGDSLHDNHSSQARPTMARSLAVGIKAEPAPSAHPERMRASLLDGKLPRGAVNATVLSDEDCAPDPNGVSHCRNKLRLPSGKTIEVRHPHRMRDVPCMTPGETVRVHRAAQA